MRKKCPYCGRSRGTQRAGETGPFPRVPCRGCWEARRETWAPHGMDALSVDLVSPEFPRKEQR